MTASPSEPATASLEDYATRVRDVLGAEGVSTDFGTVKVRVGPDNWVESVTKARDELGLVFLSWLGAVDWTNQVEVGEPPAEEVAERYEVLCTLADLEEGRRVTISTDLPREEPSLPTLVDVFPGAEWHERETYEMFGIAFDGHPNLVNLYLTDGFEGHPLRKSYALLTREVKPWPGTVDVEDMPSTENPEAEQ